MATDPASDDPASGEMIVEKHAESQSEATGAAATDHIWRRNEPDSPCEKICMIHPAARLCVGCHRTPDEISNWARMPAEQRAKIRADLPARAPQLRADPPSKRNRRRARTDV